MSVFSHLKHKSPSILFFALSNSFHCLCFHLLLSCLAGHSVVRLITQFGMCLTIRRGVGVRCCSSCTRSSQGRRRHTGVHFYNPSSYWTCLQGGYSSPLSLLSSISGKEACVQVRTGASKRCSSPQIPMERKDGVSHVALPTGMCSEALKLWGQGAPFTPAV